MAGRVDLPGGWANLLAPEKIPQFKRLQLERAQVRAGAVIDSDSKGLTEAEFDALLDVYEALIVALVWEWSYGDVTTDVLHSLPSDAYDQLRDVCKPQLDAVVPSFGPTKGEDSPTPPSGG